MTLHMLNYHYQSIKVRFDQFEILMILKNFLPNLSPFAEPSQRHLGKTFLTGARLIIYQCHICAINAHDIELCIYTLKIK